MLKISNAKVCKLFALLHRIGKNIYTFCYIFQSTVELSRECVPWVYGSISYNNAAQRLGRPTVNSTQASATMLTKVASIDCSKAAQTSSSASTVIHMPEVVFNRHKCLTKSRSVVRPRTKWIARSQHGRLRVDPAMEHSILHSTEVGQIASNITYVTTMRSWKRSHVPLDKCLTLVNRIAVIFHVYCSEKHNQMENKNRNCVENCTI